MKVQHTPGPWSFDGRPGNHIVWSDGENRVCFMAHSNGVDPERDTANARLIAAAPELLEALKGMLRVCPREQSGMVLAEYEAARAAIAKATGEA